MTALDQYQDKYDQIRFERSPAGVLEMRLHSDGGPLHWSRKVHAELYEAFWDVGNDRETRVILMTGTGDTFSGPVGDYAAHGHQTHAKWDEAFYVARELHTNLLNIDVPMIAAINGPAYRHSELPLLCDVVLAADTTVFADTGHFERGGIVPGDGINVVMQMLIGPNRSRYYHLMDQFIDASDALRLGMVSEVLPVDELLPRARAIADHLAKKPILHLRYSRRILVDPIKSELQRWVPYGLAVEGLGMTDPDGVTGESAPQASSS